MARNLTDWLTAFLEYTENTEPPLLYREWAGISCIASALERKCHSGWMRYTLYPNFFIALVGPSGIGKSQALEAIEDFLVELEVKLAPTSGSRQGIMAALKEANVVDPFPDGSVVTHSSMTIQVSELVNFIGYRDNDFINVLTDWYDCGGISGKWSNRTVSRGHEEVHGVWVNLIGGAVAENLRDALPPTAFMEGGFAGRVVFVYADVPGKPVALPILTLREKELRELLLHDLTEIYKLNGAFNVTAEWAAEWTAWYELNRRRPPFSMPAMQPYVWRRRVHLSKLCMILSASEGDGMLLTEDILHRAIELLERVETPMPNTFRGFGPSKNVQVMDALMMLISKEGNITEAKILERLGTYLEGYKQLDEFLHTLKRRKFCNITYNGAETFINYRTDHEWHERFGGRDEG